MNMFKKNKKSKEQEDALGALSGSDPAAPAKASRGLTRRKKKQEVEDKPVFDLGAALPDNNDFRTSLLMPNLSARFSMLREQDDLNTKIGKASDDSVLFPKRASRMNPFNNSALNDIAEVESIHSAFRPPFADERQHSLSDGYASDDGGSIMNRSRPGEGNNLFGGRQKLYKITTVPSKNLAASGMTGGKHMYESDVSLSAFQQMRLKEKQEREQREADETTDRSSLPATEPEEDSSRSPMIAFSKDRGTQSSTNSGPSNRRTSTAATSVMSDSPLPAQTSNSVVNKIRDIDANSSAESVGFASSPSFRKVHEEGGRAPYRLSQSRSAVNMRDNYSRQSPVSAPQAFRGMSPPLSATSQPLDFGLRDTTKPPSRLQTTSPTYQFDFDQDDTFASNVRPNDRGKATALGLFNKPARHYDDAQFQQRQMQMHEGRNSPMSTASRTASRNSPEPPSPRRPSYASTLSVGLREDPVVPQVPPIPDHPVSPMPNRAPSATSNGRASFSRPRTKSSASTKEASVKARVESLIKRQNAELAALEAAHLGPSKADASEDESPSPQKEQSGGTFFDASDNSDYESNERRPSASARSFAATMPPPPPPSDVHPALRTDMQDFDFGTNDRRPSCPQNSNYSVSSHVRPSANKSRQSEHESVVSIEDVDSPTLPTGLGLSGLIRTHLRTDSDKSSVLPPPSPAFPAEGLRGSVSSTTGIVAESVKSDAFEYDNDPLHARQPVIVPAAPPTPTAAMSQNAQQILSAAKALRDAQIAAGSTPQLVAPETSEARQDLQLNNHPDTRRHQRNASTETQREQQRFDEELAARRKRIEEGLKSVQERSRSRSPVAVRDASNDPHKFSLPRFPGRSNTGDRPEPQMPSKAMKMLGIGHGPRDPTSPRPSYDTPLDQERSRNVSSRQGSRPPMPQEHQRSNGRFTPSSGRSGPRSGTPNGYDRPPPPRSTTPSSRSGQRSRSNSAAAGRPTSRNRQVPDFDRSMMPGAFPASPMINGSAHPNFGPRSESTAESRRNERSGPSAAGNYNDRSGYLNAKPMGPPELSDKFSPRPSPRPSPIPTATSFDQIMTPMSPSSPAMQSPNPVTLGSNGRTTPSSMPGRVSPAGARKRSVTKQMISDPTFVSSTSTVSLVKLPRDGGPPVEPIEAPPLPAMNPKRRGNTAGQKADYSFGPHPAVRPTASPLPPMAESPVAPDLSSSNQSFAQPSRQQRNKLRKSSSEGGNMAARARQQALMAEMSEEKDKSPSAAVFPNRSATSLVAPPQAGMF